MEKTRRTAVIVDDEPVTRMDLADMLEEAGFRVAGEAGDGFDAVELCEEKRPDVVLMDVKMPVFDGLTAAETILSRELAGCVVLLTAFQDREIVELVLPVTDSPLVIKTQILRTLKEEGNVPLYAAKFIDLIQDEEALIRKAEFSIQIRTSD